MHTTIVGERLNCRVVVYLHFIWVGGVVEVEVSSGVTDVVEPTDGDFVTHTYKGRDARRRLLLLLPTFFKFYQER